jgi:hypothetical protein
VLALIVNCSCSTEEPPCAQSVTTMTFNDNIENTALDRIYNSANPAFPDKIVIVNMETGADIDYRLHSNGGFMNNNLHPYTTGYAKMADVWFSGLMEIFPQADAGPDLSGYITASNGLELNMFAADFGKLNCQ